jgi:CIC family chloride channel protein
MTVDSVIEKNFDKVSPEMDLGEMVSVISKAKRNLFPVVNKEGELLGVVVLDDIRNIMFRQELYHRFTVRKFMTAAPAQLRVDDSMDAVMAKFDETHAWNLPVVDADGKYMGFVSKSKIFNTYRQVLVDFSAE